jgi:hypothetical protein
MLVSFGCRVGAFQELFQHAEVARDRCFYFRDRKRADRPQQG